MLSTHRNLFFRGAECWWRALAALYFLPSPLEDIAARLRVSRKARRFRLLGRLAHDLASLRFYTGIGVFRHGRGGARFRLSFKIGT